MCEFPSAAMVSNRCWSVMINKMSGRWRGIFVELAEQASKALVNAHCKSGPEGSGPHCKTQARKVDSPGRPSRERGRVRQCSGAFGFLFSKAHNHKQAKLKRSSSSFLGGPELVACQAAKCFHIFRRSFFDHFLRQLRRRRSLVPVKRLEVIAHELFVETGRALSDDVLVLWPEARRIGRETFVDQEQIFIDCAELEFRICDDDAASLSVVAATRINFQTQRFHMLCEFFTKNMRASFHVDVLIITGFGFCRRRENRLGQLRRELESGWQLNPAHALRLLIVFPARTGELATHHAFNR